MFGFESSAKALLIYCNMLLSTLATISNYISDTPPLPRVCRDLVKEGFPLHDDHIPALLENIGDHELDVIETVLAAVANAR